MRLLIAFLVIAAGFTAPAFSQDYGAMSAAELLRNLRADIAEFKETGKIIDENTAAAETNKNLAETLRTTDASLAQRSQAYDRDVASHNTQVAAYNDKCRGGKLPEDVYTQCLTLKQNLDIQKAKLDADGDALQADHERYNNQIRDLNQKEAARAEAASQLLARYEELDRNIREIQVRLYDLAVSQDNDGFAEQVRQCTKKNSLDNIYDCMVSAFRR